MKKFELTTEFVEKYGRKLFRIKALIKFGYINAGEVGGYVEKEENLAQDSNAWVYGDAWVSGNAEVSGNDEVYGDAWVYGDAEVSGNAEVYGNARVSGDAEVSGNAWVYGDAWVSGNAEVSGNADYLLIGRIGSRFGFTTFFKNKDKGITVACGCFLGTIAEFRAKVKETHGENKHAKMYDLAADMAELQILGVDRNED